MTKVSRAFCLLMSWHMGINVDTLEWSKCTEHLMAFLSFHHALTGMVARPLGGVSREYFYLFYGLGTDTWAGSALLPRARAGRFPHSLPLDYCSVLFTIVYG